jgi:hypothetical protein
LLTDYKNPYYIWIITKYLFKSQYEEKGNLAKTKQNHTAKIITPKWVGNKKVNCKIQEYPTRAGVDSLILVSMLQISDPIRGQNCIDKICIWVKAFSLRFLSRMFGICWLLNGLIQSPCILLIPGNHKGLPLQYIKMRKS